MQKIAIIFLVFIFSYNGFSATFYVNGAIGRDLNDGKTKTKPFKTINRALMFAKGSDEIIIEGNHRNKEIVYYETLFLDKGKFSLKITGENTPVLDGSKFPNDSIPALTNYCGIYVESNLVKINEITIRNFIYKGEDTSKIYGAAIYIVAGSMRNVLTNIKIESCNWGVYLDGNSYDVLDGLIIQDIKTYGNDMGGIGIKIAPSDNGTESNRIGSEKGNQISNVDKYGICFGSRGVNTFADNTFVTKNVIDNCKSAGLAIFDIDGIVTINENVFQSNETAIFIGGVPIDTRIAENQFIGSAGESEIITVPYYDGFLLFDIWKRNGNKFSVPTYAAVNPDESKEEVIIGKNGGFIRNKIDAAKEDAWNKNKVMENK